MMREIGLAFSAVAVLVLLGGEAAGSVPDLQFHGFVSQGFIYTTDNNYLAGETTRGSFEYTEIALNASGQITDHLRAGLQLFTRDLGSVGNYEIKLDWAYLDYRVNTYFGARAGRVKMPLGLYNEYVDVDATRTWALMPQSVYPTYTRDFMLAQTGAEIYGYAALGAGGALDYRAFVGTIFLPADGAQVDVTTGGRIVWESPLEGLRLGGSYLYLDAQFPEVRGGRLFVTEFEPFHMIIGSLEYTWEGLTVAAEYSRWIYDSTSTSGTQVIETPTDYEGFYGSVAYRALDWLEVGGYYSVYFVDASRRGSLTLGGRGSGSGQQKDAALTARFDIGLHLILKAEIHFIDGNADVLASENPDPSEIARYWGLGVLKATAVF